MDKASSSDSHSSSRERETHDFMNVDSFSQLPFIRPPPLKDKPIKLFGIEFPTPVDPTNSTDSPEDSTGKDASTAASATTTENGETNRRFECHYCCRNFPTSQALGGHQNAHKRERQHAKRAHLHSEAQLYGFVNYRPFSFSSPPPPPSNAIAGARFYGAPYSSSPHHHHQHQGAINGSPLPLWRIPTATTTLQPNPNFNHRHTSSFAADQINLRASSLQLRAAAASQLQNRYVFNDSKPTLQDHVSLDLHL